MKTTELRVAEERLRVYGRMIKEIRELCPRLGPTAGMLQEEAKLKSEVERLRSEEAA